MQTGGGVEAVVVVPAGLVASHRRYFADSPGWIDALPDLAARTLTQWDLRVDGAPAFGAVALVLPVRRQDGTPAVLKLQPVDEETRGEAAALRRWAGEAAVGLLRHDDLTGSMLLESLDAARSLTAVADHLEAAEVISDLLVRLNAVPAPPGLRRLADIAADLLLTAPSAIHRAADPAEARLLRTSAGRLAELLTEDVGDRLLHWDLHYDNVLAAPHRQPAQWVAIDPKPLAGDSGFELLPALWNRWEDLVATGDPARALLRRFDLMTERLRVDRARAATWTLARVLQNAVWDLRPSGQTRLNPAHCRIAETLLAAYP